MPWGCDRDWGERRVSESYGVAAAGKEVKNISLVVAEVLGARSWVFMEVQSGSLFEANIPLSVAVDTIALKFNFDTNTN